MNISRTFALLLFIAALVGLGGCSTFTPKEMLAQFEPGEQALYGVVAGKPRKLHELSDYKQALLTNCGEMKVSNLFAPTFNQWIKKCVL